jgi:hypothetical protein
MVHKQSSWISSKSKASGSITNATKTVWLNLTGDGEPAIFSLFFSNKTFPLSLKIVHPDAFPRAAMSRHLAFYTSLNIHYILIATPQPSFQNWNL